jgi:hypothetical protein
MKDEAGVFPPSQADNQGKTCRDISTCTCTVVLGFHAVQPESLSCILSPEFFGIKLEESAKPVNVAVSAISCTLGQRYIALSHVFLSLLHPVAISSFL